jgi:transposase-like protein
MFNEHRDMAAAEAFFEQAKTVTGMTPDRVTTDGHDNHPRVIRTILGASMRHRNSQYLNNRLDQDHRGVICVVACFDHNPCRLGSTTYSVSACCHPWQGENAALTDTDRI